jgi:hypothetical protein
MRDESSRPHQGPPRRPALAVRKIVHHPTTKRQYVSAARRWLVAASRLNTRHQAGWHTSTSRSWKQPGSWSFGERLAGLAEAALARPTSPAGDVGRHRNPMHGHVYVDSALVVHSPLTRHRRTRADPPGLQRRRRALSPHPDQRTDVRAARSQLVEALSGGLCDPPRWRRSWGQYGDPAPPQANYRPRTSQIGARGSLHRLPMQGLDRAYCRQTWARSPLQTPCRRRTMPRRVAGCQRQISRYQPGARRAAGVSPFSRHP